MLLLDKDIRTLLQERVAGQELSAPYIEHGQVDCITNIGYDLRADYFLRDGKRLTECVLCPGESVFLSSQEVIGLSDRMVGRVVLKNSRIRMGLTMDAPVYQPGHVTPIYVRLTNLSGDEITLTQGERYVTLMLEQLEQSPDHPYDGTFQQEFSFRGLADYKSDYMRQIQSIGDQIHDLKSLEKSVYANVVTILTIFIGIFTILNVNLQLAGPAMDGFLFLAYNLVTLGALGFLAALMSTILGRRKGHFDPLWIPPLLCFLAAFALFWLRFS